ncbi:MAG: S-adenosylmethionine:tRNA ribosyltransferase-isomerase, partial [Caldilinea sp.]
MKTSLFDYDLPPELIAQQPAEPRDSSRLLVLHRADGRIEHRVFGEIDAYLRAGDLLVANDSRVIPARLHGRKPTGGEVEIFLLRQRDDEGKEWECLVRGRGLHAGATVTVGDVLQALIRTVTATGTRMIEFNEPVRPYLDELGETPLPPYITAYTGDRERYQTIYSRPEGSVAAPTAGLHFTPELLIELRRQGVAFDAVTLHVGLDTFKPVESERVQDHPIHTEWAELSSATARRINDATLAHGRVVAVGTTTARTLE